MKNTTKKVMGLPLTGAGLIGLAATGTGILIVDKLIPMLNGSLQAELLPGVEGGVLTGVMGVFGFAFAIFLISYLLMALLGVNALRFAKRPEEVTARTGLAKFLIFAGVVSLISSITMLGDVASFAEKLALLVPAMGQIGFAAFYLAEVKAIRRETESACA